MVTSSDFAVSRFCEASRPWRSHGVPFVGGFALYLRDPDGITIELLQHPPGGVNLEQAAREDAASA
jgi:hypothetical protein